MSDLGLARCVDGHVNFAGVRIPWLWGALDIEVWAVPWVNGPPGELCTWIERQFVGTEERFPQPYRGEGMTHVAPYDEKPTVDFADSSMACLNIGGLLVRRPLTREVDGVSPPPNLWVRRSILSGDIVWAGYDDGSENGFYQEFLDGQNEFAANHPGGQKAAWRELMVGKEFDSYTGELMTEDDFLQEWISVGAEDQRGAEAACHPDGPEAGWREILIGKEIDGHTGALMDEAGFIRFWFVCHEQLDHE